MKRIAIVLILATFVVVGFLISAPYVDFAVDHFRDRGFGMGMATGMGIAMYMLLLTAARKQIAVGLTNAWR